MHRVICYLNNNTKRKKKTCSKAGQAATFQPYSGLWRQPNKGRARRRLLASYIPKCRHRAKDVLSWSTEAKRQLTNESVLRTLQLSVPVLRATREPEWGLTERCVDLLSRFGMRIAPGRTREDLPASGLCWASWSPNVHRVGLSPLFSLLPVRSSLCMTPGF